MFFTLQVLATFNVIIFRILDFSFLFTFCDRLQVTSRKVRHQHIHIQHLLNQNRWQTTPMKRSNFRCHLVLSYGGRFKSFHEDKLVHLDERNMFTYTELRFILPRIRVLWDLTTSFSVVNLFMLPPWCHFSEPGGSGGSGCFASLVSGRTRVPLTINKIHLSLGTRKVTLSTLLPWPNDVSAFHLAISKRSPCTHFLEGEIANNLVGRGQIREHEYKSASSATSRLNRTPGTKTLADQVGKGDLSL